jgi:hypothetical protein
LRLPQANALADSDDETGTIRTTHEGVAREGAPCAVSAALGAAAHCVMLAARYLDVPLRYPTLLYGSRSMISDLISAENAASPNFPLVCTLLHVLV